MYKCVFSFIVIMLLVAVHGNLFAQHEPNKQDSFFLKKKGLIGRVARAISTTPPPDAAPEKLENPFLKYKLKRIRFINLIGLGFDRNINDTYVIKDNVWIRIARQLHKNSTAKLIRKSLFFKEGDLVYPYLVADNERYLRDLVFLQDARIIIENAGDSLNSVDVFIITKDVFSIGGHVHISGNTEGRVDLEEENLKGTGTRLAGGVYYNNDRADKAAFNAEIVRRNIKGSFVDFTAGFNNYHVSLDTFRNQEANVYLKLEKPLVTPFIPTTGAIELNYFKTYNQYYVDTLYKDQYQYEYYNVDAWFGHSLDSRRALYAEREIKVHQFAGLRVFTQRFFSIPIKYKTEYNFRFADATGVLGSYYIFRQSFYKTNYVYGFGRNEDVPEGFSIAATGGWLNRQSYKRPYAGIDMQLTNFRKKGFYNDYTFRAGGFFRNHRFEDVDLLFNIDHFSRLKKLGANWYHRIFASAGIAAQVNPFLNAPLTLNSMYGLPYFSNNNINADLRATTRLESVFFNTRKLLGLRFAPFIFGDGSLLKNTKLNLKNSDMYSAVGGGIRSRNENLIFGTMELRAYYFPRVIGGMHPWKVEFTSNLRFKYNSTFIKRPDFVQPN